MESLLPPINASPKSGEEKLTYNGLSTGYSVKDFWIWSVSDLLSNATRGRFAEFIVASALDLNPNNLRNEWDAFDLVSNEGIKIEIKSAAYIQSWNQKDYSKISFGIKPSKWWDPKNNTSKDKPKRHADVYVFCLLKHKDQATIDPLKLEQWDFYVLPTSVLDKYERSQSSITLKSLQKLATALTYNQLNQFITSSYQEAINQAI